MQQPMNHQVLGYDRAITVFSPDGRLLQVEYAKKTVKQGSTAIGMVCKDGVLLVTDKRIVDPLVVPEAVEKIFQVDDHMAATASGILSDARVLVERAQLKAQQYRVSYDEPIDTLSIVKDISNLAQLCTQSGGLRPFGVSLLVAGIDGTQGHLLETDPTGIYFEYKATVIGEGDTEAEEILYKEYKDTMSIEDGLKLAIKILVQVVDENIKVDRVDAVFIKNADKHFTRVKKEQVQTFLDAAQSAKKK